MENEKRLIDAEELCDRITATFPAMSANAMYMAIENAPTVDAVEVVRCKDCKWIEKGKGYNPYCNHWESGLFADVKDDDFCSYGERKCNE